MRVFGFALSDFVTFEDKAFKISSLEYIDGVIEHRAYRASACFQNAV